MSDIDDAAVLLINDPDYEIVIASPSGADAVIVGPNDSVKRCPQPGETAKVPLSNLSLVAASTAALGGVLFGYDIGIVSTALPQIKDEFKLNCSQQEAVVSSMLVGALLATFFGGD